VGDIERTTGHEPTSCPWRAYGDPVISAALTLRARVSAGVLDIDQQLAVVVDAHDALDAARCAVESIDRRAEREERESQQRIAESERRARAR